MLANSLRIIAVALVLIGVALGITGYILARGSQPPQVVEKANDRESGVMRRVVVTEHRLEAGQPLQPEDIAVTRRSVDRMIAAKTGFDSPAQVLGRVPKAVIEAGEVLTEDLLEAPDRATPLARHLRPGHKALALGVDETEGVGGYIVPGDTVDLIWFVDRRDLSGPYSRTLLKGLRVLAFGESIQQDMSASPGVQEWGETVDAGAISSRSRRIPLSGSQSGTDTERQPRARTVVLEVPDESVSRLMLAARTGHIRLAVTPVAPLHFVAGAVGEGARMTANSMSAGQEYEVDGLFLNALISAPQPRRATAQRRPVPAEEVRMFLGREVSMVKIN